MTRAWSRSSILAGLMFVVRWFTNANFAAAKVHHITDSRREMELEYENLECRVTIQETIRENESGLMEDDDEEMRANDRSNEAMKNKAVIRKRDIMISLSFPH